MREIESRDDCQLQEVGHLQIQSRTQPTTQTNYKLISKYNSQALRKNRRVCYKPSVAGGSKSENSSC
jgi:hypothetical protein